MAQQVLASDKILRLNNYHLLGMVQSHEVSVNMNAQDIYELGRTTKVDTALEVETSGSFELDSIGNTAGLLARMTVKRNDSTGAFEGYLYSGSSNKNNYLFTEADLVDSQFDLVVYEKPDQLNWSRSMWLPRCFVTQISGRADAAGIATETYQWGGQDLVGFDTPYHDIIAVPCTVTSSTQLAVADGTSTTGYTLAYVYVDEKRFRNSSTSDASKFSNALALTTSEGYAIPADAVCRAVFYKTATPSADFPVLADADRGTTAFYVRGAQVDLFIAPADADAPLASEQWLKVQSLDYTIDLRSESLRQLAYAANGSSIYCRVPTLPFDISVNASVYTSDWADWLAVMDPTVKDQSDVYASTYEFAPTALLTSFAVVMKYYTKNKSLLQQTSFPDLRVDSPGERTQVQGRSETTWAFRGTGFKVVGYNV
jgi:hypothetical protein